MNEDLDTIVRKENGQERNPLLLLGLDPWFLRMMSFDQLTKFIEHHRKGLALSFHSDLHRGSDNAETYGQYMAAVNAAVDKLLGDEFYFRKCLAEIKSDDKIQEYERRLKSEAGRVEKLTQENQGLRTQLSKKDSRADLLIEALARVKYAESRLLLTQCNFPLLPEFEGKMEIGEYYEDDLRFQENLVHTFTETDTYQLERRCQEHALNYLKRTNHTGQERKEKNHYGKPYPLLEAKVCGRGYKVWYQRSSKPVSIEDVQIIGSLTYSALREYLWFHGKQLKISLQQTKQSHPNAVNLRQEFSFSSSDHITRDKNLERVFPFLSKYVFPNTFLLVQKGRIQGADDYTDYILVLPRRIYESEYVSKYPMYKSSAPVNEIPESP